MSLYSVPVFAGNFWYSFLGGDDIDYHHAIFKTEGYSGGEIVNSSYEYYTILKININDIYDKYYSINKILIKKEDEVVNKIIFSPEENEIRYGDNSNSVLPVNVENIRGAAILEFQLPLKESGNYSFLFFNDNNKMIKSISKEIDVITSPGYEIIKKPIFDTKLYFAREDKKIILKINNDEKVKFKVKLYEFDDNFNILKEKKYSAYSLFKRKVSATYKMQTKNREEMSGGAIINILYKYNNKDLVLEKHLYFE